MEGQKPISGLKNRSRLGYLLFWPIVKTLCIYVFPENLSEMNDSNWQNNYIKPNSFWTKFAEANNIIFQRYINFQALFRES